MNIRKIFLLLGAVFALSISCNQSNQNSNEDDKDTKNPVIKGLGLTEQEVIDSWVYTLARYLVIRQEHIDMAEEGVDYNVIKYNELGKAEFVNPNLDVAYLEAWFAVDENTPVILEIPKIEGRYYTAQIVDEWAEILHNINERNFPDHPYGKYAICLKGSNPEIPEGALRIDIPSKKAKMLARVERQGDDEGAVALQRAFKIIKAGEPKIEKAIEIPMFSNKDLIMVDMFKKPMVVQVLKSAPDAVGNSDELQKKVFAIADFVEKSDENINSIDEIIKIKAIPSFLNSIKNFGTKKGGWSTVAEEVMDGFKENFLQRTITNYAGIWANTSREAIYYLGLKDSNGDDLNGDNTYVLHFNKEDLPIEHVNAYWSLTMLSLPDYRVIPNKLNKYNLNNISEFEYADDGSLKLFLAAELPQSVPESNWLPVAKGKSFAMTLRLYVPKDDALTYQYYVPAIQKIN